MVADNLLPVWTIAPNWSQPVRERLTWLSDVFTSETGHEQARAQRVTPRRSIEALYTPVDAHLSLFELLLQRLGRNEFMLPLWFDQGIATAVAGSVVTVDTVDREFAVGTMALLLGDDPFTFETFTISAVAAGSLTASAALTDIWPAGTKVFPLRRGWLDGESVSPVTNRVASSVLRFNMDARNDITSGAETFALYQGHPLLTHDIDWSQSLSNEYEWLSEEFDSETGLRYVVDTANRAFVMRRYGMLLEGLTEQMAYRKLLYRLEGRTKPVWIPDFSRSIEVVRPSALGSQIVDIRKIGLAYVGGITEDVAHVLIGENEVVQISALGAALAIDEERLLLAAPLTRALTPGEYGSFLHLSRLEQDAVTIEHYTDNEGVARSSLAFRGFTGGRAGAAPGDWPVPVAAMTAGGCGSDAGAWKYIREVYNSTNIYPSPSYDDSAWPLGLMAFGSEYFADPDFLGYKSPPTTPYLTQESLHLRKILVLPTAVTSVTFEAFVDNGWSMWINGTLAFTDYNAFGHENIQTVAGSYFSPGENLIYIKVVDDAANSIGIDKAYFDINILINY